MLRFERLSLDAADWEMLDAFPDRTVFQTSAWLDFLVRTQRGEPVLAALKEGGDTLGYFTGVMATYYGCRVLGSPFRGWNTQYMGFNLRPGVSRQRALEALAEWAFDELQCVHLEVMDRRLDFEDGMSLGYEATRFEGFEIDLTLSEEALFQRFSPEECRRKILQAEKRGVVVEEADDPAFVDDYYAQIQDVFAKQGRAPTYSKERVSLLIECLAPTGQILRVRARDPAGQCIATFISVAMNGTAYAWGGGSWRQHQILRPNEAIQWFVMRHWKERGIHTYDLGGPGDYKRKYGGREIGVPWFRRSKYRSVALLREAAERAVRTSRRIQTRVKTGR